ncbi:Phosphatidylinositol-4-phosphate 3-kinase C2 domain-containing subunit gamma [Myotis davidii]|uniref:Phosphatidylinositol-4-phosphate 3-kinase C2 domain-containing subunit gamma n=1 Tax=Myotis davidii TaxID=225400 RepID=L5LBA5_MYODS|nr:Phosphatidylinositol-4-phosphate 3-kinase C2 domain-containing subunit gamma [Myotis davidii]
MAYCWKTDLNPSEPHEEQPEHQELHSVNQPPSSSQLSLGFDQLVDEINNKIPFYQSEIEENTVSEPSSPKHSLDEALQISLNEFNSESSELSCHQVRKTPVIGFRPSALPNPQSINKEISGRNPTGKHHGADVYGFNISAPSSASLDQINSQTELENKNRNYHIGFERSIPSIYPSFSTDFMPKEENKRDRNANTVEPSSMLFKANYLVKDLIAEILHFWTNDQLFHKDYLLSICGYEEFLQNDHSLGSHKIFQKDKSVIQLNLQKNREAPGKLSRKHEDDHSPFFLNQLLEFMHIWKISRITFPLEIKSLPKESMLTIKLFGINCATNNAEILAWTSLPLFPKDKIILGSVLFSMTLHSEPPIEIIAPGVWDISQPSPVILQIDFPATEWEYVKLDVEDSRSNPEEPPKECLECLKHIARLSQKQSPLLLSEEKRRYLWFYRFYCNNENCSLPLVLGSAPGWDERTTSEMHSILRRWKFSHPLEALGLLTSSFPDQEIRKVAVQQLDNLLNDELLDYLPQLVQAIKFEWNLESPLVQLLLHRSLQSIQIAHRLYWLLKDAQNEAYFKSWYQKLLAALQFCAGKALSDEFSKEMKLIEILGGIGEKVKSASELQRQDVLKKEIGRLEEFFQSIHTCHLPLNPAVCIKGIDHKACSYFTSNALPLKITFINANPMGKNISIIFKAGDDLRQDMLVLQIVQMMDNIWLQEGLDMQMIIYRCLSTGKGQGLVQMVPDAVTLAKIHRHAGLMGPLKENTIKKWFSQHNHLKADYEKALSNFFYSCAGWCVVTFLLGVCDRHNDNIMLTKSGHMFHIDFGKILVHSRDCNPLSFFFHFSRKIKESLECFPVKLNNLIHTLAQMTAISPAKCTSQNFPRESCMLSATRSIQRATILRFSNMTSPLYLIQVTHSNNETSLTEKSFEQFSKLHSQLQKHFASLTLPDCETFPDKVPKVQLVITYEDVKLTILVKHMKNIHLPDGSAPSAHVEFYLLPYPSEVRRRKTKSVPKCTDPTYNEIVVYDEVTELQGHVLMLIVKSKATFVGAINIQLCNVPLNEEKWYPLGNSII